MEKWEKVQNRHRVPRVEAWKGEVEHNGLEHSDEEKTKGICKDRPMSFSVAVDWAVATNYILEGSGLDTGKNILVRL